MSRRRKELDIPDPVEFILGRQEQEPVKGEAPQQASQKAQEGPQKGSELPEVQTQGEAVKTLQRSSQGPSVAPPGYRMNPLYVETRNKRVQLLMQPSLYEKLKARADAEGRSVNDLIHSLLEAGIE